MSSEKKESRREQILRMSNEESNRFTKECICTALILLMNEQDFEKITISSIIKRAGVSRGAFYRNYSSKEDILREFDLKLAEEIKKILSNEEYRKNPFSFFYKFYQTVRASKKEFGLFIQAKYPAEFFWNARIEGWMNEFDSAADYYRSIAITSAFRDITVAWFRNGMIESDQEMAQIMVALYHPCQNLG